MATQRTFTAMDPNARISGAQAWGNLNTAAGGGLTDAHKQQAMGFINYGDQTGAQEIGGNDYNRLAEKAAEMFGGSFQAWGNGPAKSTEGNGGFQAYPWNAQPAQPASVTPGPTPTPQPLADLPAPYAFEPFRAPTRADLDSDPRYDAYRFSRDEGIDALKAQAAATGDLFTGGTMKGLADWASQNANKYISGLIDQNLGIANYNREGSLGAYDRSVDAAVLRDQELDEDRAFDFGREMYYDERTRGDREFDQRAREFESSDQFRRYTYGSDDEYRRWRSQIDDAWKRDVADEQRRQFLAELGTR